MLFFRKNKNIIPENPGWIKDPDDIRDYQHEEFFGALQAPVWQPLQIGEPKFPIRSQNGSSSCVGHAVAKALGILEYYENSVYRELSARDIYSRRSTKPSRGMWMREGMKIGKEYGATLEVLMPSNGLKEEQMNQRVDANLYTEMVGRVVKAKSFLTSQRTFDDFAGLLNQNIPIIIGVAGTSEGWKNPKDGIVRPPKKGERIWYHALVIPPENQTGKNWGLINGKKAIIFDNSWGSDWGIKGQGIITEDYLSYIYRHFYFLNLKDDYLLKEPLETDKPRYQWKRDLYYGLRNDYDVIMLQKALKFLGMFPKSVPETGNYYSITLRAVQQFQLTYKIAKVKEAGFGRCGPKTRAKLNSIFK